jgi:hypothetical protein
MKNVKLSLLATLTLAGASFATTINGPSLQNILNNITNDGSSSVNTSTDQVAIDKYWQLTASGTSAATMIIEVAGNAPDNSFGIYDVADPSKKVVLFAGAAGEGDQVAVSIHANGAVYLNIVNNTGVTFSGSTFGYFLQGPGGTFYSDDALNPGSLDHMVSFQGKGDLVTLPGLNSGNWVSNEYILAWEDLEAGDNDFDDMVVMVESVQPVPEPTTMGLMGLGLIGLMLAARRKK